MKKILITLLTILLLTPLSGIESTTGTGVLKEYELPEPAGKAWNNIKSEWMKIEYSKCLKKFKLEMSCSGCSYIHMKAVIKIDSRGKLSGYKKTGENVCGRKISPELEKCFMEPLKNQVFDETLKNTSFEVMLGTGLKC